MIKHKAITLILMIFVFSIGVSFISFAIRDSFSSGEEAISERPDESTAEMVDESDYEPPEVIEEPTALKQPGTTLDEVTLKEKLQIEEVEAERVYYITETVPNDPIHPQWYLGNISAPTAWDATTGNSDIVVAVIDTGYSLGHEDLANAWYENSGETGQTSSGEVCWTGSAVDKATNNCDDDANGFIDDWRGWDFSNNDNSSQTNEHGVGASHGTKVSGLVGARSNNSVGVASLNWQAKIMPLQGLFDEGFGYTSDIAAAVIYAVDNGADVINMSLGGANADATMKAAVDYAYENNVIIVASAGNCGDSNTGSCAGTPNPGGMKYPGRYDRVISAGATDSDNNRAYFSSYGTELDFMAPGSGSIRTPTWTNTNATTAYASSSYGTSFASPIIASMVASIKGLDSSLSFEEVYAIMENSIDKVDGMDGQNKHSEYGFGLINANSAYAQVATVSIEESTEQKTNFSLNEKPIVTTSSGHSTGSKVSFDNVSSWCITAANIECTITFRRLGSSTTAVFPTRTTNEQGVAQWSWNKLSLSTGTWEATASAGGQTSSKEIIYVE